MRSGCRGEGKPSSSLGRVLLLAIDTSTSAITVALHDGGYVVASESVLNPRAHAELLAPALTRALTTAGLAPADVTDVVVGTGPGPFTGLRVGLVTARVFAWARGVPVAGLCSLDALALGAVDSGFGGPRLAVATDARRKEVYWATYDVRGGLPVRIAGPTVERPADVRADVRELPCAGRGPLLYPQDFARPIWPLDVDAAALSRLAVHRLKAGQSLDAPEPLYLRRPDAVPSPAKPVFAAGR